MTRADSEADARDARDTSIECMALLHQTVFFAKRSCEEQFSLSYGRACGNLMGELGDIINRAAYDFPSLKPSEEEWSRVAAAQVGDDGLPTTGFESHDQIRVTLARVRARTREICARVPRMAGDPGQLEAALRRVERAVDDWLATQVR
jgi:hypothetical protein